MEFQQWSGSHLTGEDLEKAAHSSGWIMNEGLLLSIREVLKWETSLPGPFGIRAAWVFFLILDL